MSDVDIIDICKCCIHKGVCKYEKDVNIFTNSLNVFFHNNVPKDIGLTYDVNCHEFRQRVDKSVGINDLSNLAEGSCTGYVYL